MTIVWDAALTAAWARELHRSLAGDRLRALFLDHAGSGAELWFRGATLSIRLGAGEGQMLLGSASEPLDEARALAAEVERVEAPPDDRLLLIRMRRPRGSREPVLVAVELMTNQWNVIVARGEELRIRHLLREREGERVLRVGSPWRPPAGPEREGHEGEIDLARWRELLGDAPPQRRRGVLISSVAWTSPLNAPALLDPTPDGERLPPGDDFEQGHALWRAVYASTSSPEPVLLQGPSGPQPYPLPLPGIPAEPMETLAEALARSLPVPSAGGVPPLPASWLQTLEERLAASRGRVRALERELESTPDPAEARARGDLLLARFREVPRGAASVALEGFDGSRVEIELDPALTPQDNASRWYDRATRTERALHRLPELLGRAREDASGLATLLERARRGAADPDEIRELLPDRSEPAGQRRGPSLPYRRYRSSGGLEIRVGRGSKHNDELTFHHSDPEDVWLHARHAAGAHVVLRWTARDAPPARDLAEAATLAALHSRARTSSTVPVDWTRRKHVRKPRKAPPGRVILQREQTLFVQPEEGLEETLRDD